MLKHRQWYKNELSGTRQSLRIATLFSQSWTKYIGGVVVFLACFVLSFVLGSVLIQPSGSQAVTGLGLVATDPMLSLSSDSNVNLEEVMPTADGTMASGSHTLSVSTDVPTGYNMALEATKQPTEPVSGQSLTSIGSTGTAATVAAPIALTNNTWGFALNANPAGSASVTSGANTIVNGFDASYAVPTPTKTSKWANPSLNIGMGGSRIKNRSNSTTALPNNTDQTTVYYGAKLGIDLAAGSYNGTVQYTAVANLADLPVPSITSISPNVGLVSGATSIQIIGRNFTVNNQSVTTAVQLDGLNCTNVSISSDTPSAGLDTIYCDTPAHIVGGVAIEGGADVVVKTWGGTATLADSFTYRNPESFSFTIDTRMTDTTFAESDTPSSNPSHFSNTATTFAIPTSGMVGGNSDDSYNWNIDWGDASAIQSATGTAATGSAGISHNYTTPGRYQITLSSNGPATDGWMNAFGFYSTTTGANIQSNKNMFYSINTTIPSFARSKTSTSRFAYMFYGTRNVISIPADLFSETDTSSVTNLTSMFHYTFHYFAYNSTSATIPAGLFGSIDTSNATNLTSMFQYTFYSFAYNSTSATIPAGLFDSIDTSNATKLSDMFSSTFTFFASSSTVGTIPAGLFDSIDTSKATDLSYMFRSMFAYFTTKSSVANIPAGLFDSIDTSKATNLSYMFYGTFDDFAYNSSTANIPTGLFDTIDTSNATDLSYMFSTTFSDFALFSTSATIPAGLFDSIDTSNATNLSSMFYGTFQNFAYSNTSPTTNVENIWGNANFANKVTAANTGGSDGVFYNTFDDMRSLTGSAQTFIDTKLGGIIPDTDANTFLGTQVTDLTALDANWK